jgi:hypothetical protein
MNSLSPCVAPMILNYLSVEEQCLLGTVDVWWRSCLLALYRQWFPKAAPYELIRLVADLCATCHMGKNEVTLHSYNMNICMVCWEKNIVLISGETPLGFPKCESNIWPFSSFLRKSLRHVIGKNVLVPYDCTLDAFVSRSSSSPYHTWKKFNIYLSERTAIDARQRFFLEIRKFNNRLRRNRMLPYSRRRVLTIIRWSKNWRLPTHLMNSCLVSGHTLCPVCLSDERYHPIYRCPQFSCPQFSWRFNICSIVIFFVFYLYAIMCFLTQEKSIFLFFCVVLSCLKFVIN